MHKDQFQTSSSIKQDFSLKDVALFKLLNYWLIFNDHSMTLMLKPLPSLKNSKCKLITTLENYMLLTFPHQNICGFRP